MSDQVSTTDKQAIIYSRKILAKRAARVVAVQSVYSITQDNQTDKSVDEKIIDILDIYQGELAFSKLSKANHGYLIKLVRGVFKEKEFLIAQISKHLSSGWKFERLPAVIQAILLVGSCELYLDKTLSKQIVINEYLEICKIFSHTGEAGFVNSVLDKVSQER